jgi:hypothetical protein
MPENFESGPQGENEKKAGIPAWVNAEHVKQQAEESGEYYDIEVGFAPKPDREVTLEEALGETPEEVERKAKEAMEVLDGLYDYFLKGSNAWMQDDGVQRFPNPTDWYDAMNRAAMAGVIAAREVIHVAAAYKNGYAPYTEGHQSANALSQMAFGDQWKELGLPKLEV